MSIPSTTPTHSPLADPAASRSMSPSAITRASGLPAVPGLDVQRPEVSPYPRPWNGPFRILALPVEVRGICLKLADTKTLFRTAQANHQLLAESAPERISRVVHNVCTTVEFRNVLAWTESLPPFARANALRRLSAQILHLPGAGEEMLTLLDRAAEPLVARDAMFRGVIPSRETMRHALHAFAFASQVTSAEHVLAMLADVGAQPGDGSDFRLAGHPALQAELFSRLALRLLERAAFAAPDLVPHVTAAGERLKAWFSPEQQAVFDAWPSAHAATMAAIRATTASEIRTLLGGGEHHELGHRDAAPAWIRFPPVLQSNFLLEAVRSVLDLDPRGLVDSMGMLNALFVVRGIPDNSMHLRMYEAALSDMQQPGRLLPDDARQVREEETLWTARFRAWW